MKKIYSLVLLVAGVFSWGSCSLDEVNPNNSGQFSDGSYTLETYKAFTNSCYTALINNIYQSQASRHRRRPPGPAGRYRPPSPGGSDAPRRK